MIARSVYLLAGPTSSGKTAAAAVLARRMGAAVLSADSMLVYKGFDIGTAKPSPSEREGYELGGIDLETPDKPFSAGAWLRAASRFASALPPEKPLIVAGGTGLYFSALLRGLDRPWLDPPPACPFLELPRDVLRERARERIENMFAAGWAAEVAEMSRRFPVWSQTASFAIGYAEIRDSFSFPPGADPVPPPEPGFSEMKERILLRTMRLAKHQRTWFRHQTRPVPVAPAASPADTADAVAAAWRETGPAEGLFPEPGDPGMEERT